MEKSVREGLVVVYTHFCTLHCWTFGEEVILKLGMEWDYENDIFVVFVFTVVYSRCYLFYFIVVAFVLLLLPLLSFVDGTHYYFIHFLGL